MRIIAVGDSQRPPPVSADIDPDAYSVPSGQLASPPRAAPAVSPSVPPPAAQSPQNSARVGTTEEVAHVLRDEDVAPDSSERTPALLEELGREDAISVLPEELPSAIEQARNAEAKGEAKPPPPPKRVPRPPEAGPEPEAPPPVPAAAAEAPSIKGTPKSKARHPWWEDLFNEDFMRANKRLSDEQIRREVTFIEESLGVAAGGVVLDLGCGDGYHSVELASRGYGVVGYDLSLYQLALAADVAQERGQKINFLQGDMREMAFEEMFDGVFCWNTTFGYFEEEKNLAVAQRVFKSLRPGGMFLVDVVNRDYAAAQAPQQLWYEGDSCVCMDDMSIDYIASRLRVKRSIILDDGRTKESTYSLRLYTMHELGKLLHEVGFRVTEASGHPSTPGVFFGPNSPRVIMLAQRP
jgi:SAM-dependent methyltransferase